MNKNESIKESLEAFEADYGTELLSLKPSCFRDSDFLEICHFYFKFSFNGIFRLGVIRTMQGLDQDDYLEAMESVFERIDKLKNTSKVTGRILDRINTAATKATRKI